MPGKTINCNQIGLYMKYRKEGNSQEAAAAKAGFCERSARNVEKRDFKKAHIERTWRTRKDPFEKVWEKELKPMLEANPTLQAQTLLEYLQKKFEGEYPDSLLRTLQRKIQHWKTVEGPSKEVIFRQNHPPGWQGLSDFTSTSDFNVTINGELLEHILYHYRLAYSGWEHVEVILGGESFTALAESLQNAIWQCGGSPKTHRTDSLSAAYKNCSKKDGEDLTQLYQELCDHYGMEATRNNRGVSHENGAIESPHRHLKSKINQALMVRGSRDFTSVDDYRLFIREIICRQNRRIHKIYLEELSHLKDLPEKKTTDYTEERVRVTNSSTFLLKGVIYSVPSRLIGGTIKVHLYDDRLVCFAGMAHVATLSRKRKNKKSTRQIDYRHLIGELARKPGAFENYVFKEEFFPTPIFKQTWEQLRKQYDSRKACKEYITILKEAAVKDRECRVGLFLERTLANGKLVIASQVQQLFYSSSTTLPSMFTESGNLDSYGRFMGGSQQ